MDMLEFIKSRRSTRKYQDRAVEPEKIAQIIEAGCYAPSGGNNQTWHFTVIRDKDLLARTGGIVPGMSGSPVLQNGRLVGVVTHVFVNEPKRGYCIYAQWMFEKLF